MTSSAAPLDGGRGECPPADPAPADPENHCLDDASVCVRHNVGSCDRPLVENCFHHDNADRPNFIQAYNAAVVQTEHEWCRLLHLLKGIGDGHRTASSVMTLWVAHDTPPYATPHPLGTSCSRDEGRPVAIQVRLTEVTSANRIWWFDNFAFVTYTSDFRQSNRVRFRGTLPSAPPVTTLCVAESDTVVMSSWGWRNPTVLAGSGAFTPSSRVLGGATWVFPASSVQPVGTRIRRQVTGENLRVRFEVVRTGAC
ncbi:MAG TPA: hypothetical protein VFU46_08255 [Gemmatimonadales bacterium]|nr:hypothetical protein [Gemmatimonadales bacterium]